MGKVELSYGCVWSILSRRLVACCLSPKEDFLHSLEYQEVGQIDSVARAQLGGTFVEH